MEEGVAYSCPGVPCCIGVKHGGTRACIPNDLFINFFI